jgi:hypothetical protein
MTEYKCRVRHCQLSFITSEDLGYNAYCPKCSQQNIVKIKKMEK